MDGLGNMIHSLHDGRPGGCQAVASLQRWIRAAIQLWEAQHWGRGSAGNPRDCSGMDMVWVHISGETCGSVPLAQ